MRKLLGVPETLIALSVLAVAVPSNAQIPLDRFNIQRFAPAPGPGNYLQVEGANLGGHLVPGAGLTIDYGHRPFVLFNAHCTDPSETNCDVDNVNTELVSFLAQANLYGSLVLYDRIQIGLNLPLMLSGGDAFNEVVRGEPLSIDSPTQFVLSDPTISIKARIYGQGDGLFFGASVFGTIPVGHQIAPDSFLGDESLRLGGQLIAQFIHRGFHVAANVGGFWRPERTFLSTRAASQLTYRLAVGYEVTPLVLLFAEFDGASGLTSEVDENGMEARLAGRLTHGDFQVSLAAGAGLVLGAGVPVVRVIGGFAYAPSSGDRDGDGIEDSEDACPTEAEDRDGWEDSDGCPEEDDDGDGMTDDDQCPTEAEDMDGFQDEDGCPDPDNDGDGVRDGFDGCPDQPEDMDGDRDEDGCPDTDTDRDGIEDANDQCPNEPEDMDGFGDEDGCPETDFDSDGIPDDADECPDQAEIMNGVQDEDGCPEEDTDSDGIIDPVDRCPTRAETFNAQADRDGCPDGRALVEVRDEQIVLLEPIRFTRNSARLRSASVRVLRVVARLLQLYPQLRPVRVEVHTRSDGDAARSQRLSEQRAQAVVEQLGRLGIDTNRLQPVGLGGTQPLGDDQNANERVVFQVGAGTPPAAAQREPASGTSEAAGSAEAAETDGTP